MHLKEEIAMYLTDGKATILRNGILLILIYMITLGSGFQFTQRKSWESSIYASPISSGSIEVRFNLADKPEKLKKDFGNVFAINVALELFAWIEQRLPSNYDELMNSPYLPVDRKEILNPYTGEPVSVQPEVQPELIKAGEHLKRVIRKGRVKLGDISFVIKPDGGISITEYADNETDEDEVFFAHSGLSRKVFERHILGVDDPKVFPPVDAIIAERERLSALFSAMDENEKRLFAICRYIGSLMMSLPSFGFKLSLNWKELKATGVVLPVKNPYTGLSIEDVPYNSPSPGNFTYIGIFKSNNPSRFDDALPLCYNAKAEPVDPQNKEWVERYLKWETERRFLDLKTKQVVEKIVLIH